jgi:hypothetical protein
MAVLIALLSTLSAGFSLLAFIYARHCGRLGSLTDLRGPEPSSFWLGNEADIRYQNEVGDCEFKWMREYGSAWRRAGCFGVSVSCLVTLLQSLQSGTTDRSLDVGGPKSH